LFEERSNTMTTYKQLKKYSDQFGFTKEMEKLGFSIGPDDFWFYRHRGSYLDIISFWLGSSKRFVKIPIDCQKNGLIPRVDMDKFPKGFTEDYGVGSGCYMDDEGLAFASERWEVETKDKVKETFSEVLKLIKSHAEPWFKNITTDEKMFYSYSLAMQESPFGLDLWKKLNIK